jgi:ADP-heptose:LPS heptosyltransferase
MSAPALAALRARYPDAEIDVLVNQGFERLQPLFPMVNKFIVFPREVLQQELVEVDQPVFSALDRLQTFISDINAKEYRKIINLTQNKLSGYLMSLLRAEEKLGLCLSENAQPSYGSPWFQHLNDVMGAGAQATFHYADIHFFGMGLARDRASFTFTETEKGKKEAESFFAKSRFTSGRQILVQLFTSEEKKNWLPEYWVKMLKHFLILEPDARFILLQGPGDEAKMQIYVNEFQAHQLPIEVTSLSFEGTLSLLQSCDLLITVDTSIKHLAAGTTIPIVEVSLGSGNIEQTGCYRANSLMIQSREDCAPCGHSVKCPHAVRHCAVNLDPLMVGAAAAHYFKKDKISLREIAKGYDDVARLFLTQKSTIGFWHAIDLAMDCNESELSQLVDKAAWQFLLEKEHLRKLATFGSESLLLKEQIEQSWERNSATTLKMTLEQLENSSLHLENRLNRILSELSRRLRQMEGVGSADFIDDNLRQEISEVEKSMGLGHYLSEKVDLPTQLGIYRARKIQMSLNEVFQHQQIKIKLLRSIKNQLMEQP